MDLSPAGIWHAMSPLVKFISLVMIIMSVYSIWVMIERYILFNKAKKESVKLIGALSNVLTRSAYQEAIDVTKKFKQSHLAKVIAAGLLEFEASRRDKRNVDPEVAVEAARQGMDRTAMITVAEFKENLGVLATVGATAPFVGLLGTVLGIINAFEGMATSGGGIASVSAGIAEALVATAFGLMVAIPAVWAYNYFQNRVDRFTVEMSNSGSEMGIYFLKEAEFGQETK
ncbi:MAG TPA: MotA/TolQ/ExbB proton channel family protein [Thermoanaerobaculia bacterium]|nr:MotA/TolQ/ExbB proton channel family protein [Thermoanaerobaculia bacterium]